MRRLHPASISVESYLAAELESPERHEYVAGEVYAMTGASERHNLIAGNLFAALHAALRGGPCRVFMSDMKLRVEAADAFYYPDLLVVCDPADREEHFKQRACLVIEVLSASTAATDRREKLHAYRTLSSLREYVLVDQTRHAVWLYRREEPGWLLEKLGPGDRLQLETARADIPLAAIYEKVKLPPDADIREEEAVYLLAQ